MARKKSSGAERAVKGPPPSKTPEDLCAHKLGAELQMFKSLSDHSTEFIGMCDLQLRPFYVNAAGLKLVGLDSVEEAAQLRVQDFFFPEDQRLITEEFFPKVLREGKAEMEGRFRHFKTNAALWVIYTVFQIGDAEGRVTGYATVSRDITARKQAEAMTAADLEAMTRLQKIGALFVQEGNIEAVLGSIIEAAMGITGSDFGNIQLYDPGTGILRMVAQRGFPQWWVDFWQNVPPGEGGCRMALLRGERVIVEDVENSPLFAGTPALDIQLKVGVRAVQSTPLLSRSGKPLGMFSTHWKEPHRPDDRSLRLLDLLARQTADIIERAQVKAARQQAEERLAQSEQVLSELIERCPFGIYIVDADLRIAKMNARSEAGAFRNARPVVGRALEEVMRLVWPADVATEIVKRFRHTLETGEPYNSRDFTNARWDIVKVEAYEWELHPAVLPNGKHAVICYYFDSTELRLAQAALRESGERLRLAQWSAGVGVFDWDVPSGKVTWTPELEALWGLKPGTVKSYEDFRQRVNPGDLEALESKRDEAVRNHEPFDMEFRITHPSGEVRWLKSWGRAIYDESGKAVRVLGSNVDITQRKRVEEEVRQRGEELRAVLDAAPAAVWIAHDPECRVMTGNAYADEVIMHTARGANISKSALPGEAAVTYKVLRDGQELPNEELPAQRAMATGQPVPAFDMELVFPDGRELCLMAGAIPLFKARGGVRGAIVAGLDVTPLKRTQEAVRALHQRLEYHIRNTPLAVIEFDEELRVSAWSDGAQRMFGWESHEVVGRLMWEIPWIVEADRGKVEMTSEAMVCGQNSRTVGANRNLRKDGKVIWCEWYNSSLTDAKGKMQSIQSLVLDVTERKEAEAVLARDKAQLEKLVDQRTEDLREMVSELEHFSYSITHDMRAPLRAMLGFAEVVKQLCSGCAQEQQKIYLRRIQTAAQRMDLLITDALNYSRAVRSELPIVPMDVGPLLRGMLDTYPELQEAQEHIRIDPVLPLVMGNEAGLTQCFSNLLLNAVKFTSPGEVPEVRVWAERPTGDPDWVRIWVEDKGIGIEKEMLPRAFDMFARGANPQAGTGIGLALVRKVVNRMHGRVGVESEPGCGSRFWVQLRSGDPQAER